MKTVPASIGPALNSAGAGASFIPDSLYGDTNDRLKHAHNIARLAEEIHRSVQDIAPLYEIVLHQLQVSARIKDFLPILVSKKVKQRLKNH